MRKSTRFALIAVGASLVSACGSGGILNRDRPDEFAVQRQAPLVVPPDFALQPPQPGAPRPAVRGTLRRTPCRTYREDRGWPESRCRRSSKRVGRRLWRRSSR